MKFKTGDKVKYITYPEPHRNPAIPEGMLEQEFVITKTHVMGCCTIKNELHELYEYDMFLKLVEENTQ